LGRVLYRVDAPPSLPRSDPRAGVKEVSAINCRIKTFPLVPGERKLICRKVSGRPRAEMNWGWSRSRKRTKQKVHKLLRGVRFG